ncbi:MAG: Eco47II family restriction endonuclease, partial [Brevinema sp.]
MYKLGFITDDNLYIHVKQTILEYLKTLDSMDLKKFNSNLVDPIKLLFDQRVSKKTFEDTIIIEIQRQRDKTHSNIVGYFHQNIFKYLPNCEVPLKGFDMIYTNPSTSQKIFVELKNKHNTMNSSSSQATYMKMQQHIIINPNDHCYLVEVIAKKSQNIVWHSSFKGI